MALQVLTKPRFLCLDFHLPSWSGSTHLLQMYPPPPVQSILIFSCGLCSHSFFSLDKTMDPFSDILTFGHDCLPLLLNLFSHSLSSPGRVTSWIQGLTVPPARWLLNSTFSMAQIYPICGAYLQQCSHKDLKIDIWKIELIFFLLEPRSHSSQKPGWSSLTLPFP